MAVAARLVRDAGFEPIAVGGAADAARFDEGTAVWNPMAADELTDRLGLTTDPATIAHRFFAAYAAHDVDGTAALCAPARASTRCRWVTRGGAPSRMPGVPLWRSFVDAFEGFLPEVIDLRVDRDKRTAFVRSVNRGRHTRRGGRHRASGRCAGRAAPVYACSNR